MNRTFATSFSLALALTSGLSLAQTVAPPQERQAPLPGRSGELERRAQSDLARLDQDANGALERAEVESLPDLSQRFDEYDVDDDGRISANEYHSWLAAQPSRRSTAG